MGRDRYDVSRSDGILFNFLETDRVSIGSIIELGWATAPAVMSKIIIVVMDNENLHNHAMVRQLANFILPTLDQAIEIAKATLIYE